MIEEDKEVTFIIWVKIVRTNSGNENEKAGKLRSRKNSKYTYPLHRAESTEY